MATLREIREEGSGSIHRFKALALLKVLNQELGTEHGLEDIDGLTLH